MSFRFLTLVALIAPVPALAGARLDGLPKVAFSAHGSPGALDIIGKTSSGSLAERDGELVITVPLATVSTGIELRDAHMRDEYLEVATYPTAVLAVPEAGLTWPAVGAEAEGTVTSAFSVHGQTHDVAVDWRIAHTKAGYEVKASFPYDVTAWGIVIPSWLGVTIHPEMQVDAKLVIVREDAS
jgi:polyisoprenoid-binding protein YceI